MEATHFESLYPPSSREKEIAKLLAYAREGNSSQIISLPGVGKSNVIELLTYNKNVRQLHLGDNQKWFHFVPIDFSEIRNRPVADAIKFIFLNVVDSLRERKLSEEQKTVSGILRASLNLKDELVLFQGLKRAMDFLSIEKELTVVLLFDRFEQYIPMVTPEFFSDLRVLRNRAKYRFSVAFSLDRPLEDMIEPSLFADFYEFVAGHLIYLPLMDLPGLEFRAGYLEKVTGKKMEKPLLDTILHLTAGHGKLTRLCLETSLAQHFKESDPKKLKEKFLDQKTIRGALFEIWHALRPSEQHALTTKRKDFDYSYLEQIGLLKEQRITIPLLSSFLAQETTMQKTGSVSISLDSRSNEVKKGEVPISDELTSSEFRLIKFLLQNPERIIEREEIIATVWQDAKTTVGVTDQALDQLIFRLRRKIEDDPNNPTHLQTVKGRGFRFLP